jgi:ApaG protein
MGYEKVTHAIKVSVEPRYVEEQSSPQEGLWFWAYTVSIENLSDDVVQLRARHWRITDALGRHQEVQGRGVVGEEPVLRPGDMFQYTSGCPLPTPSGFMVGTYEMIGPGGRRFLIDIPAFSLDSPDAPSVVN